MESYRKNNKSNKLNERRFNMKEELTRLNLVIVSINNN